MLNSTLFISGPLSGHETPSRRVGGMLRPAPVQTHMRSYFYGQNRMRIFIEKLQKYKVYAGARYIREMCPLKESLPSPNDTQGYRRRVTCPIGDSLRHRLSVGITGYRHGSGLFYLPGTEAAGWSRGAMV
ncbi:hypothetical protein EVAR_96739_1 [Eumeta japonica]|uniref:Uncharacterized protein n=1 Tax=Eumeta variegata TaxID=151549 RepID=A0A4C1Y4A0_EUMVA|nr:hypothetical protein EVAR_96739_1 [Eumeta japonica]